MSKKPNPTRDDQAPDPVSEKLSPEGLDRTTIALIQLSQALLVANSLDDVLRASLEIIRPTGVDGVTILLAGGPSQDPYVEIAAGWEREGEPVLPTGARFSAREFSFEPFLASGRTLVINDLSADEQAIEPLRSVMLQANVKALVALPLGSRPDYFGVIFIDRAEARPFDSETVRIYEAMAVLAAGAIEKLRLIRETRRALTETTNLYEINRRLSEAQDLDEILLIIRDSEPFCAAGGTIALLETAASATRLSEGATPQAQELVFWAASGAASEEILGMRMPVSQGIVGWVVREGRPTLVPDAYADERFYRQMDQDIDFQTQSILCAPLRVEGQVIGGISLVDVQEEALSEEGLRLLSQIADQAAMFIARQKLLIETQRQADDLALLLQIGRDMTSTLDREEALRLITSRAANLVKADGCNVYFLEPGAEGKGVLVPVASSHKEYTEQILSTPIPVGQGITGRVAQSGVGQIANRIDLDPRAVRVPDTPQDPQNLIAVPLTSEGQIIGVMNISRMSERGFAESDLHMISAMAGHVASVLVNTRLYEQAQQRSQELAAVHAVASTASRSLSLKELCDATLQRVTQVIPGVVGLVCLNDQATGELKFFTHRNLPRPLVRKLRQQSMKGTLSEVTVEKGSTYYAHDLTGDNPVDTSGLVKLGLLAYLGTPLIARDRVLGTLSVFGREPNFFTPADATLLTSIGQQVGIAVRNAQLYEQTEHALGESQSLYEASQAIGRTMDIEDVLQITVTRMAEHVGADQCRIVLFDEELGYGTVRAEYRATPGIEQVRIPMQGNPSYEVLRDTGRAIAIEDIHTHPVTAQTSEMLEGYGVKSMLLVPLIARGQLIGSVGLDATQAHRTYEESEINFCRTLADRVALALDNRRLLAQTQNTLQETTMLYQASRSLTQARNLQDVLHAILDNLPIREIDQCLIALIEPEIDPTDPGVEIKAMWDHEGDESLQGARFTSQQLPVVTQLDNTETLVINDLEDESRLDPQSLDTLKSLGVKSALIVPLVTGGQLLGRLLLITHHYTYLFDPEQIHPYRTLADQAAVVIRSHQLFQQVQASLEEVENVHRQYLRDEWTSFLGTQEEKMTAMAYEEGKLQPAPDLWHPLISHAIDNGKTVTHSSFSLAPPALGAGATEPPQQALAPSETVSGTSLVTPLQVRGEIMGVLGLEDPSQTREWTPEELNMVEDIAEQVALALEGARLLDETQVNLAETARLYAATSRLSNATSANEAIKILGEEVQATLGAAYSSVFYRAGPDPAGRIEWLEVSGRWNPTEYQLTLGARLQVADIPAMAQFVGQREISIDLYSEIPDAQTRELMDVSKVRATISIPLAVGESWLGLINITSPDERRPDERTTRILQSLSDRAAVAMETMRLLEETERRAIQLDAAAKVSRAATSILETETLLPSVVELIRDHFDYYHAQVFLVNPTGHWAILEASAGEVGQLLLQRGHALEVGGTSVIGQATASGAPVIAFDTDEDALHFKNDLLPDTRSEMAIPLKLGAQVVGALDVQSAEPNAFTQDDVQVLSTLADQLTTAIQNARLYEEQRRTAEKLREVDQLKSQFLANMSHELRTPLNSIIGFSRVILKGIDGPLTELQEQDLTAIYNSGTHLLGLINDVLDHSKIESGKLDLTFDETSLTDIIKGVMSTSVALFKDKPRIKVSHYIAPDMPTIIADDTRVRQVLLNLMSNAAKFTAEGAVHLNATYDEDFVMIKVKDSGIGISPEKFAVVFQEFEQADSSTTRAYGGTGLGMSISKYFIDMHKGNIWLESEENVGTTFTVRLLIRGPGAAEEVASKFPVDPHRHSVLVIDDDADTIERYKSHLEQQPYHVIGVTESERAIKMVHELSPRAVLLDLLLPGKGSWTIIRELRSDPKTQDIAILVCNIASAAGHGFSLGVADFMLKPITADGLSASLGRLGDGTWQEREGRVLVVADTQERQLLGQAFESVSAYQVLQARSESESLEIVQQEPPDLLVLDPLVSEMDGFKVLELIKRNKETRRIPIILLTAQELTEEEYVQLNGKVVALFQKEMFEENELLQDINVMLFKAYKRLESK
jgi:GAF domain-containing protein/CheY-like chemotaxis protein